MKKNIMKRAWEIRRKAAQNHGCKVSEINMSECLKMAWAESKGENKMEKTYGLNEKELAAVKKEAEKAMALPKSERDATMTRLIKRADADVWFWAGKIKEHGSDAEMAKYRGKYELALAAQKRINALSHMIG